MGWRVPDRRCWKPESTPGKACPSERLDQQRDGSAGERIEMFHSVYKRVTELFYIQSVLCYFVRTSFLPRQRHSSVRTLVCSRIFTLNEPAKKIINDVSSLSLTYRIGLCRSVPCYSAALAVVFCQPSLNLGYLDDVSVNGTVKQNVSYNRSPAQIPQRYSSSSDFGTFFRIIYRAQAHFCQEARVLLIFSWRARRNCFERRRSTREHRQSNVPYAITWQLRTPMCTFVDLMSFGKCNFLISLKQ